MVQVKKPEVRDAILTAAGKLLSQRGYHGTTVTAIAADAGITPSTIYCYYSSKLAIVYAVFVPWLNAHMARLEAKLAGLDSPRERLRAILLTMWRDIPEADNGLFNNLVQAVAMTTAPTDKGYAREHLIDFEDRVAAMIVETLPEHHRHLAQRDMLIHTIFMAVDGYAINVKFPGSTPVTNAVEAMCDLLIGKE
ncbi:TetR family transcriptional regulator [Nocardia sp. R6R-6]|uniref:TetR family transcriptional regulator n=1 Tax=Nocardia sp. R6R-6 TaxID=3459303 RepID=UPI00403DC7BD